jgi:two-component system cell cycle response regulator
MSGQILLVDGSASQRLVLKSRLAAASYDVVAVADVAGAAASIAVSRPDLLLVDLASAGAGLAGFLRSLRSDAAGLPVLGLCPAACAELRMAALASGADDVLPQPVDEGVLLARLRNLLRRRDALSELATAAPGSAALGFAEAPAGFEAPGRIALVMADAATGAVLQAALAPLLRDRVVAVSRAQALAGPPPGAAAPDLFLIDADLGGAGGGLRLAVELLGHGASRHAALCLLRPAAAAAAEDAMAYDLGIGDVIPAGSDTAEVALRLRALLRRKRLADGLRARLHDGLRLAMTDPLTGLHNRRYAEEQLAAIADRARALGSSFAVMVVDLDRFKSVNDAYGHAAGDAVLVEVARRLAASLRAGDLLARVGGEEFLVVLPGVGLAEAEVVAGRLCAAMQDARFVLPSGRRLTITASIGLAVGNDGAAAVEGVGSVIDRADQALLRSKSAGRNQVTISRKVA